MKLKSNRAIAVDAQCRIVSTSSKVAVFQLPIKYKPVVSANMSICKAGSDRGGCARLQDSPPC
jgi:hypothetical protein